MTTGKGLETFVCELYKDLGYQDVIIGYRPSESNIQENAHAQIDLTYKKFFIRRYVECEQCTDGNVDFDDYSKFETKLETFNIPAIFGEMVTNTYFDDKIKQRAKETRIKLIDKDELTRLNSLRNSGTHIPLTTYRLIELLENGGLKTALEYFIIRYMPIEYQISYYENH